MLCDRPDRRTKNSAHEWRISPRSLTMSMLVHLGDFVLSISKISDRPRRPDSVILGLNAQSCWRGGAQIS